MNYRDYQDSRRRSETGIYIVCSDKGLLDKINNMLRFKGIIGVADAEGKFHYFVDGRKRMSRAITKVEEIVTKNAANIELDAPESMVVSALRAVLIFYDFDMSLIGTTAMYEIIRRMVIYRDVYIGTSILSFYYMVTRDLDVRNIQTFKSCVKPLISEICHFVDYAYDLIEEIRPDEIISFNGRLYENRLFYDIANALGISYTALDVVGGHVEPYKKVRYEGGLPHDIGLNTKLIENLWKTSPTFR